ncbi:hypothetical protein Agub_g3203 [Astrephomene gubernaculifera]|uniref:Uncharacterized protein n=1 Tax=Astrephomene gubernaculifera TaxID=47775 RepID=A0AAD3HIV7_9CHLO|nr:hypothetical protein Agub_g3203 [Astrephomene gubernaculifera]
MLQACIPCIPCQVHGSFSLRSSPPFHGAPRLTTLARYAAFGTPSHPRGYQDRVLKVSNIRASAHRRPNDGRNDRMEPEQPAKSGPNSEPTPAATPSKSSPPAAPPAPSTPRPYLAFSPRPSTRTRLTSPIYSSPTKKLRVFTEYVRYWWPKVPPGGLMGTQLKLRVELDGQEMTWGISNQNVCEITLYDYVKSTQSSARDVEVRGLPAPLRQKLTGSWLLGYRGRPSEGVITLVASSTEEPPLDPEWM